MVTRPGGGGALWLGNRSAIRNRLLASTAAPTNTSNRSRPWSRQRRMPRPRSRTEMRPSMPARKRCPFLNARLFSYAVRSCGLAPAPLGDTLSAHAGGGHGLHVGGGVEAAIGRIQGGDVPEGGLMLGQGGCDVHLVDGITIEHPVVGDEAAATLGQEDLVAELDRAVALPRLMRSVWGSKIEKIFSSTGTGSPSSTRRRVWAMTCSARPQKWSISAPGRSPRRPRADRRGWRCGLPRPPRAPSPRRPR